MPHVLAKMTGAPFEAIKGQLQKDAAAHAADGMHLEHLWHNDDNSDETYFLFRVEELDRCKKKMNDVHARTRRENPGAPLPELVFLKT